MLKENDRVKVHVYNSGNDKTEIKTRISDKVFTVYKKNGFLGIDYNERESPYICNGETFTPFETFSSNVIFENVDNGERYFFSNIHGLTKES